MSRDDPTVSVLMGVYDDEEYLPDAIDSVLAQTFEDFELLVVDDASPDASASVVESYDDPRIRLLRNEENRGLTRSLNRALNAARERYVARQDADDISSPHRLETQVSYLDANPDVAVLGTGAEIVDARGRRIGRRHVLCDPTLTDLRAKNRLVHGSVMARRSVFEDVGGYDELFRYSQDYDLWLRLAEDHDLRNYPEPLYSLRLHDESVYFAKKEESTLYAMLALGRSTGEFGPDTMAHVREAGIEGLRDELDETGLREFHGQLAGVYLRYGHPAQARREAERAAAAGGGDPSLYVTMLLSFLPAGLLARFREAARYGLNAKVRVRNALCRARGGT